MPKPKKRITLKQIENLAALQCTKKEAAALLEISYTKFTDLLHNNIKVAQAWERGQQKGKVSLRRKQHRLAKGNAQMAIHLGKHYLGQDEVNKLEVSGPNGSSLETIDFSKLTDVERKNLREYLTRVSAGSPDKA